MEQTLNRKQNDCIYAVFAVALGIATFGGCRAVPFVDKQLGDVDGGNVTVVELLQDDTAFSITDSDTIKRLTSIVRDAKWHRYWHTLPASMADRSITFRSQGGESAHVYFNGSLWSMSSKGILYADLETSDSEWIASLFENPPKSAQ